VDPKGGQVTTVMDGLAKPFFISAGLDRLWISLHGDPDLPPDPGATTVIGVDPKTFEVMDEIAAGPLQTFGEVAADETGIWVRQPAPFLTRYDRATLEVTQVIEATKGGGAIVVAYGSVWAASYDFGHVWRISPEAPS
jgi:streptogramin lyase